MMGCGLFIEYAFSCWPLHKLYLDVADYNLESSGRAWTSCSKRRVG